MHKLLNLSIYLSHCTNYSISLCTRLLNLVVHRLLNLAVHRLLNLVVHRLLNLAVHRLLNLAVLKLLTLSRCTVYSISFTSLTISVNLICLFGLLIILRWSTSYIPPNDRVLLFGCCLPSPLILTTVFKIYWESSMDDIKDREEGEIDIWKLEQWKQAGTKVSSSLLYFI